jgi:hypothetical protein
LGAVIVSRQFCTLSLRQKRGLFDHANESEYRQNHNDIIDIYGKRCEYGSIDILLGFSRSVFICFWNVVRCLRMDCSITLIPIQNQRQGEVIQRNLEQHYYWRLLTKQNTRITVVKKLRASEAFTSPGIYPRDDIAARCLYERGKRGGTGRYSAQGSVCIPWLLE